MPKYTQTRKTWFYAVDFKIKAVELSLRKDISSKEVAHIQREFTANKQTYGSPRVFDVLKRGG